MKGLFRIGVCLVVLLCFLSAGAVFAATWSTAQLLNVSGEKACKTPKIYPAASGGFHAMYKPTDPSPWLVRYRRYQNGVLGSAVTVHSLGFLGGSNDICEAGNGDIWCTWENWDETYLNPGEQIWAAKSSNGGASWTKYAVTNYYYNEGEGGQAKNPNIFPYGLGSSASVISCTWRAVSNRLYHNFWNGSSWVGNTDSGQWTDNSYAATGGCRNPVDGSVYRAYGQRINNYWQICMRRWNGSAWESQIQVSTNSSGDPFASRASIAINGSGQIMVVWDQDSTVMSRRWDPATGWGPQTTVASGAYASVTAIPGRTDFFVVYSRSDMNQIVGKRYVSGAWESTASAVSVGLANAYSLDADICADSTGKLYCVWEWHGGTTPPQNWYAVCTDFMGSDSTPPSSVGSVTDDGATQDVITYLHATWGTASDPESGIDHYEYSIGTSAGATNVLGWTSSGSNREMWYGNWLTNGTTYYINARAVNGMGLAGPAVSSDGILINAASNTTTFSTATVVSSSSYACDNAMIAKAADGGLHMVYRDNNNAAYKVVYTKKSSSGSWSALENVTSGSPVGSYPDVVEDTNSSIHVVYNNSTGREGMDVFERVKTGSSWNTAINVSNNNTMNWYPRLASGASGKISLIENGDTTTHTVKTATKNGSWSTFSNLGTSARYGTPDIVKSADGVLHAVWIQGNDLRYSKNTGSGWSASSVISTASGYMMPRIACDTSNYPVVVWLGTSTIGDYSIFFSRFNGSTWSARKMLGIGHYAVVAVDNANKVHVVYSSNATAGVHDVLHMVYNGTSWSTFINISNNNGASDRPALEVDANGGVHLVWEDVTTSPMKILYSSAASAPTTGTISGYVRDNAGNNLQGATVSTNVGGYTTTSAADGSYTLSNVTPGTYNVTATKTNYNPQTISNQTVTAGQTTTCTFALTPQPGTISGTVKDTNNVALSGATVSTNTGGYTTTSAADGSYTLSNVAPGTYNVTASKTNYNSQTNTNVSVTSNNTTTSNFNLAPLPGSITGTVKDASNNAISGATVSTTTGGYTTTTAANGTYTLSSVVPGTYTVTASKAGYNTGTNTGVVVNPNAATTSNFTLTAIPTEKVTNGNMEGGFFSTGWASTCSGQTSKLPGPSAAYWGWNNDASYPFNTFDATTVKHAGSHSLGFSFCQTAASPGKMGIAFQSVNLGSAGASATFSVWAYHTDGNCPSIMCWNPGSGQNNPSTAYSAGRYQWVTTDNWGQRNTWVTRSMTVTADSSGYVTIMVGGAAHPGTASGARLYIDDVSVQ